MTRFHILFFRIYSSRISSCLDALMLPGLPADPFCSVRLQFYQQSTRGKEEFHESVDV